MAEIVAETERLVLRREVEGDLAVWLEHMNTPEVMECTGGVQTAEQVAESFAKMAAADSLLSFYFLALKPGGELIGKCGLARIETPAAPAELDGAVQVGWTLRADCWGRGYAREGAQAALALVERLGMRRRADLDYPDPDYPPEDNPTMVYAISRDEWIGA